jgi:phosphatidylinositol-3-phosphatase
VRRAPARPAALLLASGLLAAACASAPGPGHPRAHAPATAAKTPGTTTASPTGGAGTGAPATTTTAAATGTTLPAGGNPCGTAATPPARYQHIVWIWMENHPWGSVLGNPPAPYLGALASRCGTDTSWADVGSPSLPNYLGATSGSTQGIADDADPSAHSFSVDNVFRQVRTAGGTERSFVESMPAPCELVSQGEYAAKHNPAVYYDGVGPGGSDRAACQADDLPLTAFLAFLASGNLPTLTSVTPNICNDMHDCSVATGDQWLATWVPRILATTSYRSGTTALFVVWDEPTPVADVVVAPGVHPGTRSGVAVTHYSLLRATEEMLGLPLLGQASTAVSLRGVFGI